MTESTGPQDQAPGPPAGRSVWELPERGRRGPRPRFSRADIAAAAIAIADRDGLDRVTVREVAAALGMAPMTLYGYLPAREHLGQLMTDALAGEYAYPDIQPGCGHQGILALAEQGRDIARRHPWLAQLAARGPVVPGPNGLRYLDYFLGLVAGPGIDAGACLELIAVISGFAAMFGAMLATPADQAGAPAAAVAAAAAGGQYANLTAAIARAGPPRTDTEVFQSCVTHLVDALSPTDAGCLAGRIPIERPLI
jgi:AcrR family transcriptional regulator